MHRRLIPALLALLLALAGCQSTASGSSGGFSGGSTTTGGTSTSGGGGVASVAQGGDSDTGSQTTTFDGCTVFFGMSPERSNLYIISASRDGIGGQVGWTCKPVSSVARLQLTATIQHALTIGGPWTTDPEPSSTATFDGDKHSGTLFPHNTTCTTDWWRTSVHIEWDEAAGGHQTRDDLHSQPKKVTNEDCHRN